MRDHLFLKIYNNIIIMHKGHYGEYSGNAKHSKVTASNMGATKKDDEAHMKYLKEDINYDNKHGHSDEKMTADEKHISKLAGDLKYDEKKQGSPAYHKAKKGGHKKLSNEEYLEHHRNDPYHGGGHKTIKKIKK